MERYWFNVHALPVLLTGVMMFASGIFVLLKRPLASVNRSFFLICLSVTAWLIPTGLGYLSIHPDQARFWFKCDNFGVMFISVAVFHFVSSFLHLKRRAAVLIGYLVAFLFGLVEMFTDWLVIGVHKYSWGYFPQWGFFSIVFFAIFFGYMAASFNSLWREHRKATEPARRNQIKYLFLAFALAYTGSVDYLPAFGIPVYPFGFVSIFVFLSVVALTIVKYRLLDITLAMTRGTIFTLVYTVVMGTPLIVAISFQTQLEQRLGTRWWVSLWVVCAILATAAHYVNQYFQRRAENRLLAEEREILDTLLRASRDMPRIRSIRRLVRVIVSVLGSRMRVSPVAVYLADPKGTQYTLASGRGYNPSPAEASLGGETPLVQYLQKRKDKGPAVREELSFQQRDGGTADLRNVVGLMKQLGAECVVPSLSKDQLLGFLILGAKQSGRMYTDGDLKTLETLANQAALGIENARFYDELQRTQADLYETKKLVDLGRMAGGMSHQVNNRFHAISVMAELVKQALEKLGDPTTLDSASLKDWWARVLDTYHKIWNNALRGGDIAKKLIKYGKPSSLEFKPIPITVKEIATIAYELSEGRIDFNLIDWLPTIPEELPQIMGELYPLGDSISNLVTNSFDAIEQKAEKLQQHQMTRAPEDPEPYRGQIKFRVHTERDDGDRPWVVMEVGDNGVGMTKDELDGLFFPFFTTKATSEKGTGLGLYVIRTIVEKHGGTIGVASTYGVGTAFTIRLPALQEEGKSHA